MNEAERLEKTRHTLAHVLAAAVAKLFPDAKPTLGPAIENGFYYDFDFSTPLTEGDLPKLEAVMRELLPAWTSFSTREVTLEDVAARFPGNPYKAELAEEIEKRGEPLTFLTAGEFTDLCRGGHVENPARDIPVDSFSLDRIAGAYWRGDEKNKMLTRIYGLGFESKVALEAYLAQREEARRRDHRKLGRELDLFVSSELVGAGFPLWTPKGTALRETLDAYVGELRRQRGYERVTIPHLTRRALYDVSGHWDKFADELFRIKTREGKEYAVKPMNCPHHTQLFARHPHSYREMPQRYAETTMVYRDEQSGELGGLTRVISITQDDSHVFCRHSQVRDEFFAIWDILDTFYGTFGFKLRVRLSFHDPKTPEKYLGTPDVWKNAEEALLSIARERGANYFEAPGEAAMYGPKLDFMATDSLGREHQVATIQLDMNLPERFDLTCVNERGEKERIVMIHCAIMGSLERFIAVLIEHTGGMFPLWLAPVQVRVLPVGEGHRAFGRELTERLRREGMRAELDATDESLGKKVRSAKLAKVPAWIVVGDKEIAASSGTLEYRDADSQGALPIPEIIATLRKTVDEKR